MPIGKSSSSNVGDAGSDRIVHSGWLIKSPPEKTLWRHKWKKTWFVLREGNYPGQYLLQYFKQKTDKKPRGTIDLNQCEQVDAGLVFESRRVDFPFIFDVKTKDRTYYLVTQTEEEMNKWVNCICRLCRFKIKEEDEIIDDSSRPASTPASLPRRPSVATVQSSTTSEGSSNSGVGANQTQISKLHHTIATSSRRASSPQIRLRHASSNATSTSHLSMASSVSPTSLPDEDEDRGPYIPLVECVSGRQANGVESGLPAHSTWQPQQIPRPTLPRYGGHNPLWYDVPSANAEIDGPDNFYKAPSGRGSIADIWYQSPKSTEKMNEPKSLAKKPAPPPPSLVDEEESLGDNQQSLMYDTPTASVNQQRSRSVEPMENRPPRPPKPSHLQATPAAVMATLSQPATTTPTTSSSDQAFNYDFPPPKSKSGEINALTVPRTKGISYAEGDRVSTTGSSSTEPSPRFDRRETEFTDYNIKNIPISTKFGNPIESPSKRQEFYDTPSNVALDLAGHFQKQILTSSGTTSKPTDPNEGYYSTPSGAPFPSITPPPSSSIPSRVKSVSPDMTTGSSRPPLIKQKTDSALDYKMDYPLAPPRVDRDLKPRRPSDCATPSPSRSPIGPRSGTGSLDSIPDEGATSIRLPVATKRTKSFQRSDATLPRVSDVVLPSRTKTETEDSSSDDEDRLLRDTDSKLATLRTSPGKTSTREYTLDQKIPPPDPSLFAPSPSMMPSGTIEYIEVEPETTGEGFFNDAQSDTVSIKTTYEPTNYSIVDFPRTKALIDMKRENEREKLFAS